MCKCLQVLQIHFVHKFILLFLVCCKQYDFRKPKLIYLIPFTFCVFKTIMACQRNQISLWRNPIMLDKQENHFVNHANIFQHDTNRGLRHFVGIYDVVYLLYTICNLRNKWNQHRIV